MDMKIIDKPSWLRQFVEMHGLLLLRLSVGLVFLWFGVLKFFPGSAAEGLATETLSLLTDGIFSKKGELCALGIVECAIGLSVLFKKGLGLTVPILYVQMAGTLLPLFIFPEQTWKSPFVPSLEGQYIIKNMVFIASGIVIGAMARGSQLITHPVVARVAKSKERRILKEEEQEHPDG